MVRIRAVERGGEYALSADGHATGSEQTCAAVSAVLDGFLGYLANSGAHARLLEAPELESGRVRLRFTGDAAAGEVWRMTLISLLQLQAAEPERVCIEWSGPGQ